MLIAIAVSCLIAGLLYSYLSGLQTEVNETQGFVVVAAVDIQKNTVITTEMLKIVPLPAEAIQKDTYTDINEAVGIIAKDAIYAGEQLNKRRLLEDAKMAGFIGTIPSDKRAVAVGITDITGVAGFANPGNFVDVMLVTAKDKKNMITGKILLQDIMLLAVNKNENSETKGNNKEQMATATLAASPEEAVKLAVAQQQGTLYLALRPVHPDKRISLNNEINVYQASDNDRSSSEQVAYKPAPTPPPLAAKDYTPPPSTNAEPSGETISVIRGNSVQSVTTR